MEEVDKVLCMGNNDCATTAALMNNNNWMNNPFMYLIWLAFFGKNGFGGYGGDGAGLQGAELMSRLNLIQTQMSDSFNAQNTNGIIASNHDAINTGFASTAAGISNVVNSGLLNSKDMQAAMQSCCCGTQKEILKMGYENQIGNLNQTNQLGNQINEVRQALVNGFANIGYTTAQQTCELKTNQNENTQRIVDTLNCHWNSELQQKYADAKLELSQLNQNATLIAALKTA